MFGWLKDKRFCVICRCNFCLPSLRPSNVLPNIQWPSNRPTREPRYPPFALTWLGATFSTWLWATFSTWLGATFSTWLGATFSTGKKVVGELSVCVGRSHRRGRGSYVAVKQFDILGQLNKTSQVASGENGFCSELQCFLNVDNWLFFWWLGLFCCHTKWGFSKNIFNVSFIVVVVFVYRGLFS